MIDYSFNQVKIEKEYRFDIPQLTDNSPVILHQDAMIIVVARYNNDILNQLLVTSERAFRVDSKGYFVALAYGTDLGCPVQFTENHFKESCSNATYDLLGQSLNQSAFKNLAIPHYRWNKNFTALTIYQE